MSLIQCPACSSPVSPAAPTCPKCGHPVAGQKTEATTGKDAVIVVATLVISLLLLIGGLPYVDSASIPGVVKLLLIFGIPIGPPLTAMIYASRRKL